MDSAHVPLPVASLCRRARNARSAAERHLAAYHAWEGSIRLAVAATPPPAATDLSAPSIGTWVSFCRPREALLAEAGLLAAYRLFSAEGLGKRTQAPSVSGRRLLDALPAYRNAVIGHGGSRDESFYAEAGAALLDGIEDAWRADLFWPADARLLLVDAVALDARGGRRARLVEICGMASLVRGDGEPVPDGARPGRLYLEAGGALRPLHPWVIYQPQAPGRAERVLFFDKLRRGPEYLDYTSGDVVKGKPLADAFPGLDADCLELSRERPAAAVGAADESGPATVGDYRILGKLGEGGMGVVYLARQESLGRLVTVKMLPAEAARDETAMARFQREVNALARADHPNIVKILSCGRALGTAYYAMELIEGADLCEVQRALAAGAPDVPSAITTASSNVRRAKAELFENLPDVVHRHAALPGGADRFAVFARFMRDAAMGLHHLHERGIVHRDVKPSNIMVTPEGRAVVMDLGLAAVSDASRTITRDHASILGTLRYMPPEQLHRKLLDLDRRADVYALGATFYELFTGRSFFDGDTEVRLLQQILHEEPVDPRVARPDLPESIRTVLLKATRKLPEERHPTAIALAEDLDAFLAGRRVRHAAPAGRRRVALVAGVAIVAAGVAAGAVLLRRTTPPPGPSAPSAAAPAAPPPAAAGPVTQVPAPEVTARAAEPVPPPPPNERVGTAPKPSGSGRGKAPSQSRPPSERPAVAQSPAFVTPTKSADAARNVDLTKQLADDPTP